MNGHGHRHGAEGTHGPTGPACVVADVGGDMGAAVVYTPAGLVGEELEIRGGDRAWDGAHTAIRERRLGTVTRWAGFFGALPAASYEVRVKGDPSRTLRFDVTGASVTEVQW